MRIRLQPALLFAGAALAASPLFAQEVTELGSVPDTKPPIAPITGKPLSGEQIFERSVPSLVLIRVKIDNENGCLGSGFFATDDGLIVTNAHVVKDAKSITVTTNDNQIVPVSALLAYDEKLDLAVIKAPTGKRPKVTLATRKPKVGATVYAVGNPSGLSNTLSKGMVSGIRPGVAGDLTSEVARDASRENISAFVIQHTAAISGGSSGGMLLAETGELIGVNTFALTAAKDAFFAVSAADVEVILAAARKNQPKPLEQPRPAVSKPASTGSEGPKPAPEAFDFAALPASTVQRLNDAAPNYAYIGYRVCQIQLLNMATELSKKAAPTDEERDILAYLLRKDTPLIYSADGKFSWHSIDSAHQEMNVQKAIARIVSTRQGRTLLDTGKAMLLINRLYPDAKVGEEITVYYVPDDPVTMEIGGVSTQVATGDWCYHTKTLTGETLGRALFKNKITSLITTRVEHEPARRIIHQTRVGRGTEYTAENTPARTSHKITFTSIYLQKFPSKSTP